MNIKYLQEYISNFGEIEILGRIIKLDKSIYNILGFVQYENRLKMFVLQHNEEFVSKEEYERCELDQKISTHREILKAEDAGIPMNVFSLLKSIAWGKKKLEVNGSQHTQCNVQDWETIAIIFQFLKNGWQPVGIENIPMDELFLSTIEFSGESHCVPDFDEDIAIKLTLASEDKRYLVEQPFSLEIGGEYKDKLWYKDERDQEHWLKIHSVYLYDIWSEIGQCFEEPQDKEDLLLEEICPKGMYFPVIEYECTEDTTLQLHLKSWLNALEKTSDSASSMGLIMAPDKKTGVLGYPLKLAMIQEPVSANTKVIDVELFSIIQSESREDIIIR